MAERYAWHDGFSTAGWSQTQLPSLHRGISTALAHHCILQRWGLAVGLLPWMQVSWWICALGSKLPAFSCIWYVPTCSGGPWVTVQPDHDYARPDQWEQKWGWRVLYASHLLMDRVICQRRACRFICKSFINCAGQCSHVQCLLTATCIDYIKVPKILKRTLSTENPCE